LLAVTLAGCSGTAANTTTGVTATGTTLTVFLSDPPAVRADPALQDVVDGEQLAFNEHAAAVKNVSLRARTLTNGSQVSDLARAAIESNSAIAYVGEVQSGLSRQTVGITNAEDLLELSPTDPVKPSQANFESFTSYGRTFASLPLDLTTSPAALNRADPGFAGDFRHAFGHAPSADAIEGYDAVWVLLRVIAAEGDHANDRAKVAASVIATLKENAGRASVPAFTITLK
jgi:ABC-type branched-subunit amino acid transport system substrate-binding protein